MGRNQAAMQGRLQGVGNFEANGPLTLLVVNVKWPPETFILRTLEFVRAAGIQVLLMVSTSPGEKLPRTSDMRIIKQPTWNGPWLYRLSFSLRLLAIKAIRCPRSLYRMLCILNGQSENRLALQERLVMFFRLLPFVGLKPDVLHFQWNAAAIEFRQLFDFFDCPTVVSCRGSQVNIAPHGPRSPMIRDGLRETFAKASAVHCVSEAIKSQAVEYGLDSSKAWIIRPAVDADFFCQARSADRISAGFRVISVGSLTWVKGYEFALLAVRRLLDWGLPVEFDIVGVGPDRQRILYTVHDLGLQEHVHFHGRVSPTKVRELLRGADAFLLSSLSEGISNAILEAMACGLPVVATACGGMREVISDGIEGLVVPVRDVNAMATALRRIALDEELSHRLGKAARQRIEREFDLKQHGAQFLQLYSQNSLRPVVR